MCTISVIIPVYNAEKFLNETINSVLSQTYSDFELLLLDDGSTDKSVKIIQSYKDSRIKLIECHHDFINTINTGLDLSKGKYIALLDHDDLMLPYRLKIQYDFMEQNQEVIACGGRMHTFGKHSRIISKPEGHDDIMLASLLDSPILNPTGFIKKETIVKNNIKYKRVYDFSSDYKFWSDMVKIGPLANIPRILTLYRLHDKQTTSIYCKEINENHHIIRLEMLEYFLSNLTTDNEIARKIDNILIPVLNDLGEFSIFSANTFFSFMYELISWMKKSKLINI